MKDTIRDAIQGGGMPSLKELFQFAVSNDVHIYI